MGKGLKKGLLNIRDAKRGIERLEDQVSASPVVHKALVQHSTGQEVATSITLTIPITGPRLWSWDSTKYWGFRLTWIGTIIALVCSWLIAETVTCEYICHPKYAVTNDFSVHDPFWGMALPTLVDRMTGGLLSLSGTLLAVTSEWVGDVWSAGNSIQGNKIRPKFVWDAETSMLDDEVL
jgi:hypothetical protein